MKSLFKKILVGILITESKIILNKYKPIVISVTGNVGKTSTKDAIFTVLSNTIFTRKSEKSYNSEIGLPLTILGCKNGWNNPFIWIENIFIGLELILFKSEYPKCLVLEIGADHPGDIESISKWLKSDIVVVTKIGDVPVHIEAFKNVDELVKEKSYLIKTLKADGVLILSSDSKSVANMSLGIKQRVITFGIEQIAQITASDTSIAYDSNNYPIGMNFKLKVEDTEAQVNLSGILGVQQIYPVLAAISVGIARNLDLNLIINNLSKHVSPKGRMNIIRGINNSTIIDDSYNSSPDALHEGLKTLKSIQCSGRKIAILGDMMELGSYSTEEHKKAGVQAVQSSDILITVGQRSKVMSENAISFNNAKEAGEYSKTVISNGDLIYIKGSQSMRMERVVKEIMAEPEKSSELIVRQEQEWLSKK